jgi:hypothetical protein
MQSSLSVFSRLRYAQYPDEAGIWVYANRDMWSEPADVCGFHR